MPEVRLPRPEWYDATPAEAFHIGFQLPQKADDDIRADAVERDAWLNDAVVVAPMTPPHPRQ